LTRGVKIHLGSDVVGRDFFGDLVVAHLPGRLDDFSLAGGQLVQWILWALVAADALEGRT
jgi:hypothetical protein